MATPAPKFSATALFYTLKRPRVQRGQASKLPQLHRVKRQSGLGFLAPANSSLTAKNVIEPRFCVACGLALLGLNPGVFLSNSVLNVCGEI
jgi:hypothetical protein